MRFARYLDERRWDEYSALFTEDGILELPFGSWSGPAMIRAHVQADFAKYTATQHINSNYDIELDGDTANARATFVATHVTESDGTASLARRRRLPPRASPDRRGHGESDD